jgi:hypothetical protein
MLTTDCNKEGPTGVTATPFFAEDGVIVHHGRALDVLRTLPDASVDSVCTDPPYALPGGFMGKDWDRFGDAAGGAAGRAFQVWCEQWATECLRVLKPGGHMLAFGGTRTYHRLVCAVEDAGFEIRDSVAVMAWAYSTGFPKSLDVSKAIDTAAGAERKVIGFGPDHAKRTAAGGAGLTVCREGENAPIGQILTAPATDEARRWEGWKTALKPAFEPIVVARKPLAGTVAANVLAYGTGALNIDGCRVAHASERDLAASLAKNPGRADLVTSNTYGADRPQQSVNVDGRWPTNLLLVHHPACSDALCEPDCHVAEMDRQTGYSSSRSSAPRHGRAGAGWRTTASGAEYDDEGGGSRFFPCFRYEPKAPTAERPVVDGVAHPTVKPLTLVRWMQRLVTPPGGTVLDLFTGSGTGVEAAILEGFLIIAVEREAPYLPLIAERIRRAKTATPGRRLTATAAKADDGQMGLFGDLDEIAQVDDCPRDAG